MGRSSWKNKAQLWSVSLYAKRLLSDVLVTFWCMFAPLFLAPDQSFAYVLFVKIIKVAACLFNAVYSKLPISSFVYSR
jgi:hypothetical protein